MTLTESAQATERLYFQNAYLQEFSARVIGREAREGSPVIILDRTAFYPESGGQPHDLGWLNEVRVIRVEEEADRILHFIEKELAENAVRGRLDWPRRFDHMQQHTGQHILSQAFVRAAQATTVGFHLGTDIVTIDLNRANLSPSVIEQAEDIANQIVFQDRPVSARFVTAQELEHIPLRKPPKVEHNIRVVQVEGFDWSACGGTHVARTGEIGLIKIIKVERRGNEARVEFQCGQRALTDYRRKNDMLNRVAADLSVGYWELDQAVARLQADVRDARRKLAEVESKLMLAEAVELIAAARNVGAFAVVARAWDDRDMNALRLVAKKLIEQPRIVALLGAAGRERSALVFARSADVTVDVSVWLRQAVQQLGGKGGGQPDMAQGGAGPARLEEVQAILDQIAERLSLSQNS